MSLLAETRPESIQIDDDHQGRTLDVVGDPLTAPGGPVRAREQTRQLCVVMSSGQFFVSQSHLSNPHVKSLATLARQMGFEVNEPTPVELDTIRKIYDQTTTKEKNALQTEETANQRELLRIIGEAARRGSSDIHVVVNANAAVVRMRIDGVMQNIQEMPPAHGRDLCGTAHAMCDAADASYSPLEFQGARISQQSADLPKGVQAVRVQWNPLAFGGRFMVMRLLVTETETKKKIETAKSGLDGLGYMPQHLKALEYMRAQPLGINITSGPVNSGKSTTMAKILNQLLAECNYERTCLTVEDPPEYIIEGAQQLPVTNAKTAEERGLKFQAAIEAALRSDPNILMIGEVRGPESAKLAFQGAMVGTQVWTSLHANSALHILDRLRDIGVENFKLTDPGIVTGLIGQRLIRVLCEGCKTSLDEAVSAGRVEPGSAGRARTLLSDLGRCDRAIHARGPGCDACDGKGYSGRTAVSEIIIPDEAFMSLVREGKKAEAREHWLREMGGFSMLTHAVVKMLSGVTGPVEIEQSTGVLVSDPHMKAFLDREGL